jgi:putative glutamine amidotransferase
MKLFRFFVLFMMVFCSIWTNTYGLTVPQDETVIVLCSPRVKFFKNMEATNQIKNIEWMYEKEILPLNKIKIIGLYHQDEVTDYREAMEYVKNNRMTWVSFLEITGDVNTENLFKENAWTQQFRAVFNRSHGIIFTGGADIPPAIFKEETNLLTRVSTPVRHYYELSMLFHLIGGRQNPNFIPFLKTRENYVILGLCLGAQTMNVAAGGTLIQDIPSQVYGQKTFEQVLHSSKESVHSSAYIKSLHPLARNLPPAFHRIKLKKNSIFVKKMKMKKKDTPYVLTSHHQAIKTLGKGLRTVATSMDGKIIEAIEHEVFKNVLGVQFHPEYYPLYQKGRFFRKGPGQSLNFNLRAFLVNHPPSMIFHHRLWAWFAGALRGK